MDEFFLQYLWRYQRFKTPKLKVTTGESLDVFHPGFQNENAGPDFSEARIKIGSLTWSGSVEVHYKSSDWYLHQHQQDLSYQNVVLHVVWSADREVYTPDGKPIPTLELSYYVPDNLDQEYRNYMTRPAVIRCGQNLKNVEEIYITSMLDTAFAERLKEKSKNVIAMAQSCSQDWEETAYRLMARSFGFKVNSEPFERLAISLPYKILKKHLDQPHLVEAMLFGQAGFLDKPADEHAATLHKEYQHLSKKYALTKHLSAYQWKFSRLRPANFPTVRLAQFLGMVQANKHLFNQLIAVENLTDAKKIIKTPLPEYWKHHFDFGKASTSTTPIGDTSIENLVINAMVPLLGAYAKYMDDQSLLERAERLLEHLKSEQNKYIRKWQEVGIHSKNAKDSQALLHQFQHYCHQKKCLQCSIGISIIGS